MHASYKKIYSSIAVSLTIGTAIMVPIIALQLPDTYSWDAVIRQYWPSVLMSIAYTWVLGEGNSYLSEQLDRLIRWIDRPAKRLLLSIVVMFAYSTVAILLIQWVMGKLVWEDRCDCVLTWEGYYLNNMYLPLAITVVIMTALISRKFLLEWRRSAIEAERLRSAHLASQYQSLKDQVNPHFLFNSLNTLTYLVYENQNQAAQFINKLSEVYRYVLDTRDQEVVSLSEELAFVHSYVFLQRIRFENALRVQIDVPEATAYHIPPLALQMLLENAIKHNEISQAAPLKLTISTEDNGWLVVKNNVQLKSYRESSSGIGLDNIRARYAYLTKEKVTVVNDSRHFTVRLPLLRVSPIESSTKAFTTTI